MSTVTAAPWTLGQLARRVGLARSSLLHYEALGLLTPLARSPAGYRLYGEAELARLQAIRRLRDSGLPLADIQRLLMPPEQPGLPAGATPRLILQQRLLDLSVEIGHIRTQQRQLALLLASPELSPGPQRWTKSSWVALLRHAGFSDAAMHLWHIEFERSKPGDHAAFLQSLGLAPDEVNSIRCWSRSEQN